MILVVGATGLVGHEVCRILSKRGNSFRALVRETSDAARVDAILKMGGEIVRGDVKDPVSLRQACEGIKRVISTASSTTSRGEGDSISSVDRDGQLNLVDAAREADVKKFVFVSFRNKEGLDYPLDRAKRAVEQALEKSGMEWCSLQSSFFMEIWLSPHLGFNFQEGEVRIYGEGVNPISFISYKDVARYAVEAAESANLQGIVPVGGPEALSPKEAVARFEKATGKDFKIEQVPEEALRQQYENADNEIDKTFAGLMLAYSRGDKITSMPNIPDHHFRLSSLDDYVRSVTP